MGAPANKPEHTRGRPFEPGNTVGHRFQPGQSGNPSGLPKEIAEIRKALLTCLPKATERLLELLDHEDGELRLKAIREVYDRTMGKAKERVEVSQLDAKAEEFESLSAEEQRRLFVETGAKQFGLRLVEDEK